jgi:hypothetical protein
MVQQVICSSRYHVLRQDESDKLALNNGFSLLNCQSQTTFAYANNPVHESGTPTLKDFEQTIC